VVALGLDAGADLAQLLMLDLYLFLGDPQLLQRGRQLLQGGRQQGLALHRLQGALLEPVAAAAASPLPPAVTGAHLAGYQVRGYAGLLEARCAGRAMEIHHAAQDGRVIVSFTGSIDLFTVAAVQRALRKDLAEQPYGLICDLSAVDHLDPVCATVFATVVNHPSRRWPATGFASCGARPQVAELLGRLWMPDFLPLYAGVDEALDAVLDRPPYLRDELVLAPIPTAATAARAFVRQVCRYWELALPDATVVERAVLLANELVTAPDPQAEGGRGLWLSSSWPSLGR
jgi:anti-sigma B factor antagonist